MVLQSILFQITTLFLIPSLCVVNVNIDGEYLQVCNNDGPSYVISELSKSDQHKVHKLEFVQALFRHGLRVEKQDNAPEKFFPEYALDNLPPNGDWVINCNISSIISSQLTDWSHPLAPNNNKNPKLKLRKKYIQNEQYYSHSNCEQEQSLYETIGQMASNADTIKNAYIRDPYNNHKKYLFNKNIFNDADNIRLYSTDTSRTMDSLFWFADALISKKKDIFDIISHDIASEPFRIDKNIKCSREPQWQEWTERYEESTDNSKIKNEYEMSSDVQYRFEAQGGVWLKDGLTPHTLGFHYCAGLDLPISFDLLQDMDTFDREREASVDLSDNGKEKNYCYNHIINLASYKLLLDAINEMKSGNGPKLLAISNHAGNIRAYLWGLDIDGDHTFPEMAELTTLEIYSANKYYNIHKKKKNKNKIEYYFRWTRRGEFLPYPECKHIYDSQNTQLCDLEIMLNKDFKDVVAMDEFNNNICPNAVDLCLCGLCDNV
eukprot:97199_1